MTVGIREYCESDAEDSIKIWNTVVEEGVAFPQTECLNIKTGNDFFLSQTYTAVAFDMETKEIVGLYILHPNNVGRCGHICNASYAVKRGLRGQHIGEKLVTDCLKRAKECGFKIMQFNAVVKSNYAASHLYEKLGFVRLGSVPNGFKLKNGSFEDIILYYCIL